MNPEQTPEPRRTKRYSMRGGSKVSGLGAASWSEQTERTLHEHVFAHISNLKTRQVRRRYQNAIYQQLYNNNLQSITASSSLFSSTIATALASYNRLSTNIVKPLVKTATARIAKAKPRPFILPKRGGPGRFKMKRAARMLQKYLDGVMKHSGFYSESELGFRDGAIYGDGYLLFFVEGDEIKAQCLKIDEVWIDQVDGMYNDPQEIHWEHPTPRKKLLALYPEFEREINEARLNWRGEMAFMSQTDLVLTAHSWRKPSVPGGDDGVHSVCIPNATMKREPYDKDYLPILRWQWDVPTYGCFGTGIASDEEGKQWMITNMMRDIAESIHKFAVPRVWLEAMSEVCQTSVTNEAGTVNYYTGREPLFSTPAAMAPDVYAYRRELIKDAFEEQGLSQLSAQSQKPAGLNAAVALRTLQDIETQRFSIEGQRWERLYVAGAEIILDMSADLYKKKGKLTVSVPGRGFIEEIDWGAIDLKRDQYDIEVWPTSILPESPEGKRQEATEWAQSGFMPKDVILQQMRLPIIDDFIDEETAPRENIERMLERILGDEKAIDVSLLPVTDLQLALKMFSSARLQANTDDEPPHVQDLLQRALDEITARVAQMQAPSAPMAAPPGPAGAPAGQAAPPPPAPLAPQGSGPVAVPNAA